MVDAKAHARDEGEHEWNTPKLDTTHASRHSLIERHTIIQCFPLFLCYISP